MAIFHRHRIACRCGTMLEADLAESVNVVERPHVRAAILAGTLHRATCPACRRTMTVEAPFCYADPARNILISVRPRGQRPFYRSASRRLDGAAGLVKDSGWFSRPPTLRLVYGMDELREKLVAQDAGLDDRLVELLKVLVIYEHPFLLRRARLRLALHAVTHDTLLFGAGHDHDARRYRIAMPAHVVQRIAAPGVAEAWASEAHHASLFDLPDHWISMARWSPQPDALAQLRAYADTLAQTHFVDVTDPAFLLMVQRLPRGAHLPRWAKRDLRALSVIARRSGYARVERALFEVRFNTELDDDWTTNDNPDDIDTLWDLLEQLPETDVEGNTMLDAIDLTDADNSTYDAATHDIAISADDLADDDRFAAAVRHEVGHAVHEMHRPMIDRWLRDRFGWQVFHATEAGVEGWVALMGGWGGLDPGQRAEVRRVLLLALGTGGRWQASAIPALPASHPWHISDLAPRKAVEQTGERWYENTGAWLKVGATAFFANFWYPCLCAVSISTLAQIAAMPRNYAAMSDREFFAELYSWLRSDAAAVPPDIATWMNQSLPATS